MLMRTELGLGCDVLAALGEPVCWQSTPLLVQGSTSSVFGASVLVLFRAFHY